MKTYCTEILLTYTLPWCWRLYETMWYIFSFKSSSGQALLWLIICNIMATWLCHVILLVIISIIIPLTLLIALTYHLIFIGFYSQYIKPHLFIVRNWYFYIILLKKTSAIILCVETYLYSPPFYDCWVSAL